MSLAWEAFGEKNGAATFHEMRQKIAGLRTEDVDPCEDFRDRLHSTPAAFFLPQAEWLPVPCDFHRSLMQGKGFDTDSGTGKDLWDMIQMRFASQAAPQFQVGDGTVMWSNPVLVKQRLGQGAFRILVTDTYQRQCAVTQRESSSRSRSRSHPTCY